MSSDLFIPIKFKTNVILKPNELDNDIDKIILKKLKASYENICSKYGYIKNNSIKIKSRSIGIGINQHFNGNFKYTVICMAEICNPIQGSIIKCRVKAKNSLGLLAEGFYEKIPILEIIIPKISAGIQSDINLDTINIGQEIKIEVCGKKYQLYDKHISIIGRAIKNKDEFVKNAIIEDADEDTTVAPIDDDNIELYNEEDDEPLPSDNEQEEDDEEISKKAKDDDEDEEDEEEDDEFIDEEEDIDDILSGGEGDFDDVYDGGYD
jgi:DNA-directed RNA polymerase subunit E'/Rpb7